MWETFEKILPFLAHLPRWLQIFFLAVLFQVLVVVFLGIVYGLRGTMSRNQPPTVRAVPILPNSTHQSNAPSEAPERPLADGVTKKQHHSPKRASKGSSSLRISSVLEQSGDFPVLNVTVMNASTGPITLTAFDVEVLNYEPYTSVPESHILTPIALVDVVLPFSRGVFPYKLNPPILVAANDAVLVAYRFHAEYKGKVIPPSEVGGYTIRLVLRADTGATGATDVVEF